MVARILAVQVRDLIDTSIGETVLTDSFIDTAHVYVDSNLLSTSHSEAMLAKIELYLAAHFVAITEERGGLRSTKLGDSTDAFADVYSAGLNSTRFGQIALTLDTSGTLAAIGTTGLKAEFRVV